MEAAGSNPCTDAGGACLVEQDGFYVVVAASLLLGLALGLVYVRKLPALMALPLESWRYGPDPAAPPQVAVAGGADGHVEKKDKEA